MGGEGGRNTILSRAVVDVVKQTIKERKGGGRKNRRENRCCERYAAINRDQAIETFIIPNSRLPNVPLTGKKKDDDDDVEEEEGSVDARGENSAFVRQREKKEKREKGKAKEKEKERDTIAESKKKKLTGVWDRTGNLWEKKQGLLNYSPLALFDNIAIGMSCEE